MIEMTYTLHSQRQDLFAFFLLTQQRSLVGAQAILPVQQQVIGTLDRPGDLSHNVAIGWTLQPLSRSGRYFCLVRGRRRFLGAAGCARPSREDEVDHGLAASR